MARSACRRCGADKADGRCPNCIIGAVKLEIRKPLNTSWEKFGFQLRAIQSMFHRMMNAGMIHDAAGYDAMVAAEAEGRELSDEEKSKTKPYSYQTMVRCRDDLSAWYAKTAKKKAKEARSLRKAAAKAPPKEAKELSEKAAKAEESSEFNQKRSEAIGALNTGIIAYTQHVVDAKFKVWRKLGPSTGLPMYRKGHPILVPGTSFRVLDYSDYGVRINLKLIAHDATDILAVPVSGSAWQALRSVEAGDVITGDIKIVHQAARRRGPKAQELDGGHKKGKWILLLSTIAARPSREADPNVVVAVNRGRHNFLYAVSSTGRYDVLVQGGDILAFKRQMEHRKRSLKAKRGHRGRGALGHGEGRYHESETRLRDAEKDFVRSQCQQAAAALDKFCTKAGAGVVVCDDFRTIEEEDLRYMPSWPWSQLADAIKRMCDKTGRYFKAEESANISNTCPCCFNRSASQVKPPSAAHLSLVPEPKGGSALRAWNFRCAKCGYVRPSDFVACYNLLQRSGADTSVWDKKFEHYLKSMEKMKGDDDGQQERPKAVSRARAASSRSQKTRSRA